jgi:hypothetical protein
MAPEAPSLGPILEAAQRSAVLVVANGPPPGSMAMRVRGLIQASGHGPMLVTEGSHTAIIEIGEHAVQVRRCDDPKLGIVGGATTPAGLRFVSRLGALVAIEVDGPCRVLTAPAVTDAE